MYPSRQASTSGVSIPPNLRWTADALYLGLAAAAVGPQLAGLGCCDTTGVNDNGLSYFGDYVLGAMYECGSVSVDQASIVAFGKEFDPQPFHVDPVAAAVGPFGGLIASGWHTAALVMRLLVENYLAAESSLGSAGLDELRWPHPVRPGDTLRVRGTVVESRRSLSKPDRGIVKTAVEAVNADGQTAMRATAINFMLVRPDPGT